MQEFHIYVAIMRTIVYNLIVIHRNTKIHRRIYGKGFFTMKKKFAALLACTMAAAIALTGCGGSGSNGGSSASDGGSSAGGKQTLVLATGGETGTYYAVGGVLASTLNPLLQNSSINVTTSGGSKDDIEQIEDGVAQMGTVQNDVMSYAAHGTDLFEAAGACTNFQAIAGLYDETCQIIASPGIKSVEDLKGKTVSVGDAGSGVEFNARQILAAYGIDIDKDINKVNSGFSASADGLKDGKIDAAFVTAGAPTTAVTDLATTKEISIVPVDAAHADALIDEYPFYTKSFIPAGTYNGVDVDTETVAVRATLVVSKDISEDVVYELTKAMFENKEKMAESQSKFNELSLDTALNGIDVDFHPGAQKYYEEQGVWKS